MTFEQMMLVASTLVVIGLAIGLAYRKQAKKHMKIMIGCLVADVGIVLAIELNNHAINQATKPDAGPLLTFHVWVSLIMVIGYFVALFTGLKLNKGGSDKVRKIHKINAGIFVLCRVLNYITSFMV